MPAQCAITGKTRKRVKKRSKSMRATITHVKPNLIRVRVGNKWVKISARALRTLKSRRTAKKAA